MKIKAENIGGKVVYFNFINEAVEVFGESQDRETRPTGIGEEVKDAYAQMKQVINQIADDIGKGLKSIKNKPNEIEIEFQVGLSAQVGPVVFLGGKAESTMSVKMSWKLVKDANK